MSMQYFDPVAQDETVSHVTATNSVQLGTRRYWQAEEYVYVYNAGGQDIQPQYGTKLVTGTSGYSIANTCLADVAHLAVGVVKHATIPASSYGWVMTKGYTSLTHHPNSTCSALDYAQMSLGLSGTFHLSTPITTATHYGTFAVCALGLGVSIACGGTFYGFVKTGF